MKIEMKHSFSTLPVKRLSELMNECKDFAEFLIAVRREEEAQVTPEEIRPYLEGEHILSTEDEAALEAGMECKHGRAFYACYECENEGAGEITSAEWAVRSVTFNIHSQMWLASIGTNNKAVARVDIWGPTHTATERFANGLVAIVKRFPDLLRKLDRFERGLDLDRGEIASLREQLRKKGEFPSVEDGQRAIARHWAKVEAQEKK